MIRDRRSAALEALAPYIERARNFSGWNIDSLDVRPLDAPPPWEYESLVREYARGATSVLDLGTGGGERLASMRMSLPERVVATEEWVPNVPVAQRALGRLGVSIVAARSRSLPFADASFSLVLSRHEELQPSEVARVLRAGGTVVTQQVGPEHWRELRVFFPRIPPPYDHFEAYPRGFAGAGLRLDRVEEHEQRMAYGSLGDIVFMLIVAPWTVPDFDPERDIDALLALEDAFAGEGGIALTETRYVIVAHKSA